MFYVQPNNFPGDDDFQCVWPARHWVNMRRSTVHRDDAYLECNHSRRWLNWRTHYVNDMQRHCFHDPTGQQTLNQTLNASVYLNIPLSSAQRNNVSSKRKTYWMLDCSSLKQTMTLFPDVFNPMTKYLKLTTQFNR